MVVPLKSLNIVIRISMCIILLPFYCFSNRLNNRKTIRTGHRKNMFFLQITSAKSRHPMDDVGVLKDTHRPSGERPVSLLGFQLAARASTLFRILRPERACLRNSPARASDEAGPTCILQLRDVSLRSFVPFSTATSRIQVGPVSPDARAAFANGCCAPCLRPERAASGQTGKIGLGAISPHPPRGLGGRLSFSLFNARLFASLIAALLKSSQPRAGPGASLRSTEAGERSRAAHSKQRLLVVCLKPASLRSAETGRRFRAAQGKQRLMVVCLKRPAALGRWRRLQRLAPQAGLKASRRQFASFLSACVGLALPSVGWPCMLSGKGSFCARKPMQSHAFALPYLRWARWHDPATACFAPLV